MNRFSGAMLIALLYALSVRAHLHAQQPAGTSGSPAQPQGGAFQIAGIVVNATSGAPLDRVDVTVSPAGEQQDIAAIRTGEDGSFVFNGMRAGKYRVAASRRGYVTAAYQEHQGFFTGIVTGPGLDTSHLRFEIRATAILSGTVTDDAGDPVSGASVTLFRRNSADGEGNAIRMQIDTTDDRGAFEFTRLQAGTFFISASAKPWYAFHPQQRLRFVNGMQTEQEPVRSPLDVAYPLTFYADATDSGAATPIALHAGDHAQINLAMHAVPAVQLRVKLPELPADLNGVRPQRGFSVPMITQGAFGTNENVGAGQIRVNGSSDGRFFEISGLAPGDYSMEFPSQNGQGRGAPTQIKLLGDQMIDPSSTAAGVEVNGTLSLAFGAKAPQNLSVSLAPVNGRSRGVGQMVSETGAFTFHDVASGSYELIVTGAGRRLPVLNVASAGKQIEGGQIQIGSDAVTLTAAVATGSGSINGFIQRGGQPLGGAMVVLVPHNPKLNRYLFRRDQSDSDGSFTLRDVVPGRYTLIAIDDGWELEWARDGVLAKYLAQGREVELKGDAEKIDLPDPIEAQVR